MSHIFIKILLITYMITMGYKNSVARSFLEAMKLNYPKVTKPIPNYQTDPSDKHEANNFETNPVKFRDEFSYHLQNKPFKKYSIQSPMALLSYGIGLNTTIYIYQFDIQPIMFRGNFGLLPKKPLHTLELLGDFENGFKLGASFVYAQAKSKIQFNKLGLYTKEKVDLKINEKMIALMTEVIYELPLGDITPYIGVSFGVAHHKIKMNSATFKKNQDQSTPEDIKDHNTRQYKNQYTSMAYGFTVGFLTDYMPMLSFPAIEFDIAYSLTNFGFKDRMIKVGGFEYPTNFINYKKIGMVSNIMLNVFIKL